MPYIRQWLGQFMGFTPNRSDSLNASVHCSAFCGGLSSIFFWSFSRLSEVAAMYMFSAYDGRCPDVWKSSLSKICGVITSS